MRKFKYVVYGGYKNIKWLCWLGDYIETATMNRNVGTEKECRKMLDNLQNNYPNYSYGIAPVVVSSRK